MNFQIAKILPFPEQFKIMLSQVLYGWFAQCGLWARNVNGKDLTSVYHFNQPSFSPCFNQHSSLLHANGLLWRPSVRFEGCLWEALELNVSEELSDELSVWTLLNIFQFNVFH